MTPKQQYADKLKDPRWQKKRLEVMQAAKWRCVCCGHEDKTLHIHHLRYVGENPWDTPDALLECLCEECHLSREQSNRMFIEMIREASTKSLDQFGCNVAAALRIAKTAPPEVQAAGDASFILTLFNMAIERVWKESSDSSLHASSRAGTQPQD